MAYWAKQRQPRTNRAKKRKKDKIKKRKRRKKLGSEPQSCGLLSRISVTIIKGLYATTKKPSHTDDSLGPSRKQNPVKGQKHSAPKWGRASGRTSSPNKGGQYHFTTPPPRSGKALWDTSVAAPPTTQGHYTQKPLLQAWHHTGQGAKSVGRVEWGGVGCGEGKRLTRQWTQRQNEGGEAGREG